MNVDIKGEKTLILKEYIDKIDFESPYINRIKYVREIITILESGWDIYMKYKGVFILLHFVSMSRYRDSSERILILQGIIYSKSNLWYL